MATYSELADIRSDPLFPAFQNKVRVATVIKAVAYLEGATPTQAQIDWSKATLAKPNEAGDDVLWFVVGTNSGVAIATILGASDNAIQTNVNAAVDALVS